MCLLGGVLFMLLVLRDYCWSTLFVDVACYCGVVSLIGCCRMACVVSCLLRRAFCL